MYTNTPSTYNNIFNTPRSMTNILLLIISCKKIKLTMLLYITLSRDLKWSCLNVQPLRANADRHNEIFFPFSFSIHLLISTTTSTTTTTTT